MGTGLGPAQRRMLETLTEQGALTIAELTGITGLTTRRVHAVANSLADRELVYISHEGIGHKGVGEYGALVRRDVIEAGQHRGRYRWVNLDTVPAVLVKAGEPFPGTMDERTARDTALTSTSLARERAREMRAATEGMTPDEAEEYRETAERSYAAIDREREKRRPRTVGKDTLFIYTGVPIYGLRVYTIEYYRAERARNIANNVAARKRFGIPPMTTEHIIEMFGPEV